MLDMWFSGHAGHIVIMVNGQGYIYPFGHIPQMGESLLHVLSVFGEFSCIHRHKSFTQNVLKTEIVRKAPSSSEPWWQGGSVSSVTIRRLSLCPTRAKVLLTFVGVSLSLG